MVNDVYFETFMRCVSEIKLELLDIKNDINKINDSINELKKENDTLKQKNNKKKWLIFLKLGGSCLLIISTTFFILPSDSFRTINNPFS